MLIKFLNAKANLFNFEFNYPLRNINNYIQININKSIYVAAR